MSLETALSIAGFAVSLGGLIPVFFLHDKRKEIVFTIVITVLVLISGVAVYKNYQHWNLVDNVSRDIVVKLSNNVWTLDQLFQALYYVEFGVFHEALNRAINNGTVNHEILEVRDNQGTIYRPRVYYVNTERKRGQTPFLGSKIGRRFGSDGFLETASALTERSSRPCYAGG